MQSKTKPQNRELTKVLDAISFVAGQMLSPTGLKRWGMTREDIINEFTAVIDRRLKEEEQSREYQRRREQREQRREREGLASYSIESTRQYRRENRLDLETGEPLLK